MEDETQHANFSYDEEEMLDFDSLEDYSFEDEIDDEDLVPGTLDDGPYSMPQSENAPKFKLVAFDNAESAQERITTLFERMMSHQKVLMSVLELCEKPTSSNEIDEKITDLQQYHHSVYTPLTFCNLLERAGAIIKTDAEGTSLEDLVQEPLKIVKDGVEYWIVAPSPEIYWAMSEDGRNYYDAYKPIEQIKHVYEEEPQYAEIFTTVLNMCKASGGAQVKTIGDVVDDDPIVQKPKRYAMYFIDKLERAGALDWQNAWVITDAGLSFLEDQEK